MPLDTYNAKRDFAKTPEPAGRVRKNRGKATFVIQEHHASHLHYDFRLEAEGVLKSWAVPKQPTLDPGVKRLAMQVEDHPLAYGRFSGVIPQGEYGGGTVYIWDHGTYDNLMADKPQPMDMRQALEKGHVEVELHGEKLHGAFALIRTRGLARSDGKQSWLLIKMKDRYARPGAAKKVDEKRKAEPQRTPKPSKRPSRQAASTRPAPAGVEQHGTPRQIQFTHEDKILFPAAKLTKGDVLHYYEQAADVLLPHLRNRPITLERLPDGLKAGAPHFWQKNTPSHYPDWVARIELDTEGGKPVRYTLVNNVETLLYLVNQGALTFHIYFSRVQNLQRPDFLLFDLDPGDAPFSTAVTIARAIHTHLAKQRIDSFIKTSGKSGLHVLVANTHEDYDSARAWALQVATEIAEAHPTLATIERSKAKRKGRLYLDVMQNALGHHMVAPYCLRATPTATVSTPLAWREVTARLDPGKFTLEAMLKRLKRQKQDPLAALSQNPSQ
jgi:bifunctional non-homologous end joining protein LigD